MLPRILESEVMDRPEEAREYDAMDHSAVNARFVSDFIAVHGQGQGGGTPRHRHRPGADSDCPLPGRSSVQDSGCGPRRPDARPRPAERRRGGPDRPDPLRPGRCQESPPFPDGRFEAVVSNTIVHHIPEPAATLAEMVRLVKPGGTLMTRDLARPDDDASVEALVERHAGTEPVAARNLFRASLHSSLTLDEVRG